MQPVLDANDSAMSRHAPFKFRIYVADNALNSAQALANLDALCQAYVPDRHHIEVVDVLRKPMRALTDGIFMTPTTVTLAPAPRRRIVGSLSQTDLVVRALGLKS